MIEEETNFDLFVSGALNTYLGQTRLSMEQVAKKWKVSSAMLSLVRNNKKSVGIDLGLKILREAGVNPSDRKQWLEKKVFSLSDESKIVEVDLKVERKTTQIMSSICEQMGQSKILLDIFLDISLSEETGIAHNAILKDYGHRGIQEVSLLVTAKICRVQENRYFINEINNIFAYDGRTSFEIVNNLIREQRLNFLNGEFKGMLEFDVTDITKEGYQELKEIQKEYQTKIRKSLDKNQSHRRAGGVRVFSQSIISILKTTTLLLIVSLLNVKEGYARGGVTGSAGGDRSLPTAIEFNEKISIDLGRLKTLIIRGNSARLGKKNFKFRKSFVKTKYFENKEDAIRQTIETQHSIANETKNREYKKIISNSQYASMCATFTVGTYEPVNKHFFRFNGFAIEESYDLDGKPRFNGKIDLDILCKTKK